MKRREPVGESFLDLTGVACPMNFVRIKIALDRMPAGTYLRVRVDSGPTLREVRKSLIEQGYEVSDCDKSGEGTDFFVKR